MNLRRVSRQALGPDLRRDSDLLFYIVRIIGFQVQHATYWSRVSRRDCNALNNRLHKPMWSTGPLGQWIPWSPMNQFGALIPWNHKRREDWEVRTIRAVGIITDVCGEISVYVIVRVEIAVSELFTLPSDRRAGQTPIWTVETWSDIWYGHSPAIQLVLATNNNIYRRGKKCASLKKIGVTFF